MFPTRSVRLILPVALLLAASACQRQAAPVDTAADNAALLAAAEEFPRTFNERNVDAVIALYAEDAKLLPPGGTAISGRAAIRDHYASEIANNAPQLTLAVEGSGVSGVWGWRSGTWSAAMTPPATGKFLEIFRRTPEGWRRYREMWNDDAARPAASAETPAAPAQ